MMTELEDMERCSEESTFDIDVSSDEFTDGIQLPVAALDSSDIDHLLRQPDILPRLLNCRPLDNRSYGIKLPGSDEEVRITTDGEVFSYCSDSQLMFSYGNQIFETVLDEAAPLSGEDSRTGICWIVEHNGTRKFLLATNDAVQHVQTFRELEGALLDVSSPRELSFEFQVIERIV